MITDTQNVSKIFFPDTIYFTHTLGRPVFLWQSSKQTSQFSFRRNECLIKNCHI